jgi:hypothetical protein
MKVRIIVAVVIAASIGLTTWAVVEMNDWENRCNDAGGQVISEYIGQIDTPIYGDKGQITGWVSTPNYAYSCQNDREEEIEV